MKLSNILLEAYQLLFEGTKTRTAYPEHYLNSFLEDFVKKYSGDDYFVRYVDSWKDKKNNRRVSEVGVKPTYRDHNGNVIVKSMWNNPRGIYCYWLDDVKSSKNASFATDSDTAFIIKRKHVGNQINDISQLSKSEFEKYSTKLKEYLISSNNELGIHTENEYESFMNKTRSLSNNKSDGGTLFYAIVRLSGISDLHDVRQTYIWRNVLGVTFIGDKGAGIIHPAESSQALFLDKKAYEVIHKVRNTSKGSDRFAKNASINPENSYNIKDLRSMILSNNIEGARKLIQMGVTLDPNALTSEMLSSNLQIIEDILKDAIETRHVETVKVALQAGAPYDQSTLSDAIRRGNPEIVKLVLQAGAPYDRHTLNVALRSGNPKMVKLALQAGADTNDDTLPAALGSGNPEMVKLALQAGAEVKYYSLLLPAAVRSGNPEMVKLALQMGAEVKDDTSLLPDAIKTRNPEMVKLILQAGAEIKDYSLLTAAVETENPEVIKLIIDAGIKPNTRVINKAIRNLGKYKTTLEEDIRLLELLIDNTETPIESESLALAIESARPAIVKLIFDAGAPVDSNVIHRILHSRTTGLLKDIPELRKKIISEYLSNEIPSIEKLRPRDMDIGSAIHVSKILDTDEILKLFVDNGMFRHYQSLDAIARLEPIDIIFMVNKTYNELELVYFDSVETLRGYVKSNPNEEVDELPDDMQGLYDEASAIASLADKALTESSVMHDDQKFYLTADAKSAMKKITADIDDYGAVI